MDIPALKQQARTLEQQGSVDDALEVYRQILAELEAIGGVRQELPLLIKIGDLLAKSDDADGAAGMYERAAGEYALQGSAQPVISLCVKILRANPQETGAYLRLARRLLDAGHIEGCREVLIDYAQRGQLDKTREGLEALAGRPDDEVKRLLDKAIFAAERRVARRPARPARPARPPRPRRVPRDAAPAAPPVPAPEDEPPAPPEVEPAPEEEEPESEPESPGPPRRRLTVPVGALDAEPTPDLAQARPPEPNPQAAFPTAADLASSEESRRPEEQRQPRETRPQDAFPTAEDLQAPVMPPLAAPLPPPPPLASAPPPAAPAPPPVAEELPVEPPPPPPPPLEIEHTPPQPLMFDTSLAPLPRGSEPALERPELPPEEPPSWSLGRPDPRPEFAAPPELASPPPPSPRVSRPHPSPVRPRRASVAARAPRRAARGRPGWLWPLTVVLVLAAGGILVWRGVIPLDRLRLAFRRKEPAASATAPTRGRPRGDSVMARDTAGFSRPAPARPAPEAPFAPTLVLPQVPLTLPPGVTLTRQIYAVKGLHIESVTPDSSEGRVGYRIVQLLPAGQRLVLEEMPSDTLVAGEIGVTGIGPDTVVGHTGVGGLAVTLKGVITETMVVQLLQQLVPIGP